MSDLLVSLILIITGIFAGSINVTAGGGSTLTLPVMILLGLDPAMANGTNRIALLMQNVSAVYSFKQEKYSQFRLSLKMSLLTLPGAILGAFFAVRISGEVFETILGIIMLLIVVSFIIPKKKFEFNNADDKRLNIPSVLALLGVGFYGGFIQVGIGFILMSVLHYLMKFNLIYVNVHKVFIVLIYTVPVLLIFILSGNVNWFMGISLAVGNSIGAWWAAKYNIKKGDKFIKFFMIIVVLILSVKMLNIF